MTKEHKNTIQAIKDYISRSQEYELFSKRFFKEEIKPVGGRGTWGYTPDVLIRRKSDGAQIIIEVEYGVSLGKVIEDIILSNIVEPAPLLVIITCYTTYVEAWYQLLKRKYNLTRLTFKVVGCNGDNDTEYAKVVSDLERILKESLPHFSANEN